MRLRNFVATVALGLFVPISIQGSKGERAILDIAHVTRHGGQTHETSIHVMRDHGYFLLGVYQEQLSSQPNCTQSFGVLSKKSFQQITTLKDSSPLRPIRNSPGAIGRQGGDFWYISIPRKTGTQFLAFNAGDKNTPDVVKHLIGWFEDTEKLKPLRSIAMKDYQCNVFSDKTAEAWRQ